MDNDGQMRNEFARVVEVAYNISKDIGQEVESILNEGIRNPLSKEEAVKLLTTVITVLKRSAQKRGDKDVEGVLEGDIKGMVDSIIKLRERVSGDTAPSTTPRKKVALVEYNGIKPGPVFPKPCFHGKEIPMNSGYVKTTDIELWDRNERLDIHLGQFKQKNGREPSADELLDIMLSKMPLQGIEDGDQFKIVELARSIAVNGVRKPPIIDTDRTLLDGNRRVAACRFIMSSSGDEFSSEQKARVEYIFVWQLTEHTTLDDRQAVVVSLNFESDCKQDWPDYVKARKVYDEWQTMLSLEARTPGPERMAQMKRELSKRFALGPDTAVVKRYIEMVEWANEFEEYHENLKKRDKFEVKHRADRYFQYFDELNKGKKAGGVNYTLNQDEGYKQMVFEMLYDGKFRNWKQIRDLNLIHENQEALEALAKCHAETNLDLAEKHLDDATTIARIQRAAYRSLGVNSRIEDFVKWLEELPLKAFRDDITPLNLINLLKALKLVEKQSISMLGEDRVKQAFTEG